MQHGNPAPLPLILPECSCPRSHPFNIDLPYSTDGSWPFYSVSSIASSVTCSDGIHDIQVFRISQDNPSNDPKSIFSSFGWMSDYTDTAEVIIDLPQALMVSA